MLEKCILPVFETDERQSIGGQCFMVGDYLITASHVVEKLYRPYVMCDGHRFYLTKDNAIVYSNNKSEDEDIAIFSMQGVNSPLFFKEPLTSELALTCYSISKADPQTCRLEFKHYNVCILSIVSNKAIICEVSPMLCEHDSGCPIVTENYEVIGMLVGGVGDAPCNNICGFQSAAFIKDLINQQHRFK